MQIYIAIISDVIAITVAYFFYRLLCTFKRRRKAKNHINKQSGDNCGIDRENDNAV